MYPDYSNKCTHCGGERHRWSYTSKFCSNKCRQAAYRKRKAQAQDELKRNARRKPTKKKVAKKKK